MDAAGSVLNSWRIYEAVGPLVFRIVYSEHVTAVFPMEALELESMDAMVFGEC